MRSFAVLLVAAAACSPAVASRRPTQVNRTGDLSVVYGTNLAAFTRSTIDLWGPGYSLRLADVTASDDPGFRSFADLWNTSAQWDARLSYQVTPTLLVSAGVDHMKYVVDWNQFARTTGYVDPSASERYAGVYKNRLVQLGGDSVIGNFEHTDGLNYWYGDVSYSGELYASPKHIFALFGAIGGSVGVVIPRTDTTLFGERLNARFALSGYGAAATAGLRAELFRYGFIELRGQMGAMHLPGVLTVRDGRASQAFGFVCGVLSIGFTLTIGEWMRGNAIRFD